MAERDGGSEHNSGATSPTASDVPRLGKPIDRSVVGPFQLISRLGEGGFGEVFLAEQASPVKRRVALKLIKPGMDSREVLGRFETERELLALMDHPNIARVLDAGKADDGRPYFAMEYVAGLPITEYCENARLDFQERLKLILTVCEALQHAHQKGVIHRDLKPSNILVSETKDGVVPKIIDFGIAKAIDAAAIAASAFTRIGQFIGTPEYMSPEQADLSPLGVDVRSDVYSLGVVMYQVLTGELPIDPIALRSAGLDEIRRLIREVPATKPSTRVAERSRATSGSGGSRRTRGSHDVHLSRALRGDIDWIVLRCLEKDRRRRYASADALAEDLRRHLHHEPVDASPPTAVYRARKFVERHRVGVVVTALAATAFSFGSLTAFWQWRVAETERQLAETRLSQIRDFSGQFLDELVADLAKRPGTTQSRQAAANAAIELLDGLAGLEDDETALQQDLGLAYLRVASISADSDASVSVVLKAHERASTLLAAVANRLATNPSAWLDSARAHSGLARVLLRAGREPAANEAAIVALDHLRRAEGIGSAPPVARSSLMRTLGRVAMAGGDDEVARSRFDSAIEAAVAATDAEPDSASAWLERATAEAESANHFKTREKWNDAIRSFKSAVGSLDRAEAFSPGDARIASERVRVLRGLGNAALNGGQTETARDAYNEAGSVAEQVARANPFDPVALQAWFDVYDDAADVLFKQGEYHGASDNYAQFRQRAKLLMESDPLNTRFRAKYLLATEKLADPVRELHKWAMADEDQAAAMRHVGQMYPLYREAFDGFSALSDQEPTNTEWKRDLIRCGRKLEIALFWNGRASERENVLTRIVEIADQLDAMRILTPERETDRSLALRSLAYIHLEGGDLDAAWEAGERARQTAPSDDPMLGKVIGLLANVRARQERFDAAVLLAEQAIAQFEKTPADKRETRQIEELDRLGVQIEHYRRGKLP